MPPDGSGRYPNQGGQYRTYTNSVFVNKTILVPTYEEKYDTTALRIYRENLPGYNVVGINCNSIIGSLGAIHCITKTVGDDDPLLIAHARLRDSEDAFLEYPVVAHIKHRDGIEGADLYYRVAPDSFYTQVPMVLVDSVANNWAALIPPQPAGGEMQYYIHAYARNGKQQVRPMVAPEGYFRFRIQGEIANQPPAVQITQPADQSVFTIDIPSIDIQFDASDVDGSVAQAIIYINGEELASMDTLPYSFTWSIPSEGSFTIVVVAIDDDGAVTSSDSVHILIEGTTAIDDIENSHGITLFPNPVEDILVIRMNDTRSSVADIEVYNVFGQLQDVLPNYGVRQTSLDFSQLPSGVYLLKVRDGKEEWGYKVVKR